MKENTRADLELTPDPRVAIFHTNRELSETRETYASIAAALDGSPLAALLATIEGVVALELDGSDVTLTRDEAVPWDDIALQVVEALKDFFLL
ncbi:MAG TPA: NifU N-terminal domain-containing protein [Anaerolineae bacterium]|nr:NifU N-terminal domain-containing protein [Anaerolineae bacterium]